MCIQAPLRTIGLKETRPSWEEKRTNGVVAQKPLVGGWVVTLTHPY